MFGAYWPANIWATTPPFSMHLLFLVLIKLPSSVEPHNFSPLHPARHFDERVLRDYPPTTIKVVTKDGTKSLQRVKEGGTDVWKWVKEGVKKAAPAAAPAAAAPAAAAPAGPIYVFDPPTQAEQKRLQFKLLKNNEFDVRARKDVYAEFHKVVKELENGKKVIPSQTQPALAVAVETTSDNLYRALSYALTGTELLHKVVRKIVLEYFEGFFGQWDKKQAQPWMDEFDVRSVRRQAEKIKSGKPGGMVELVAAAKKFSMNVLVYKTDKDQWLCMSPKTAHRMELDRKADCQDKDMMTIALELYDNEHFDVIVDVEAKKKK